VLDSVGGPGDSFDAGISGNITFTEDNASLDGRTALRSGQIRYWDIQLDGTIEAAADNVSLDLTQVNLHIINGETLNVTQSASKFTLLRFGKITVDAGGTFGIDSGVADLIELHALINSGTADFSDVNMSFLGSRESAIQVALQNTGTLTVDCKTVFLDTTYAFAGQRIVGDVAFGSAIQTAANVYYEVMDGSTFSCKDVRLFGGSFGAYENGGNPGGLADITITGDIVADGGQYRFGEGKHTLTGATLDFGGSAGYANAIASPNPANNLKAQVRLVRGSAQTLAFEGTVGSLFMISEVSPDAPITVTGRMRLMDTLDLTAQTTAASFGSSTFDLVAGDGISSEAWSVNALLGDGAVTMRGLEVRQVPSSTPTSANLLVVEPKSAWNGTLQVSSVLVQGDNNDGTAGTESNAGTLDLRGLTMTVHTGFTVESGDSSAGGAGGTLYLNACSIVFDDGIDFDLSQGNTPSLIHEGGKAYIVSSTLTFGDGSGFNVGLWATLTVTDSTLTGTGAWTMLTDTSAGLVTIYGSTVTAMTAGDLTITLAGIGLRTAGTTFQNHDASGVVMRGTLAVLHSCTFINGQAGGTHLDVSNLDNASILTCDNNHFDGSVGLGAADRLVKGVKPLTFRAGVNSNFGAAGVTINAATAEANDGDGTVAASNVIWVEGVDSLTVALNGAQPGGAYNSATSDQRAFNFTLTADAGTSSVAQFSVTLTLDGLAIGDIANMRLYYDANANGSYAGADGDSILQTITTPAGTTVSFTPGAEVLAATESRSYGVLITFAPTIAGKRGQLRLMILPPLGLTESNGNVQVGLPISSTLELHGLATQLAMITQPAGGTPGTAFSTQPVVEFRDANGQRVWANNVTNTTAAIVTAPSGAALTGTAVVKAALGRVTWTNLGADTVGSYTLSFTAGALTTTSSSFDVAATPPPPPPASGGCSVGGPADTASGWWLLALLAVMVVARRKRTP
ncbi:MAG: MYXO-CTERM sorting domain-containing protein, partial [Planctomycetota bacterium]